MQWTPEPANSEVLDLPSYFSLFVGDYLMQSGFRQWNNIFLLKFLCFLCLIYCTAKITCFEHYIEVTFWLNKKMVYLKNYKYLFWIGKNTILCLVSVFRFFFYSDVIIFLKMHRGLVTQHKNTLFFEYLFILNQPHIVKLRFTSLKLLLFIFPKHRKSIYYCFQIIHAPSKKAEKFIGVISHPE